MSTLRPRAVLVTRQTELAELLARHGTRGQVDFFLSARGQDIAAIEARDAAQTSAIAAAKASVPQDWSFVHVDRDDLSRFLFFPQDIVIALGQDGLVANLAKYLDGQPVIGVAPVRGVSEGVLTRHALTSLPDVLRRASTDDVDYEARRMICATLPGDTSLLALNDVFIGHRSHQSARYDLRFGQESEFQSSSGMIVSTGTGLTGWARSIMAATDANYAFAPTEDKAAFFAREPWPSHATGTAVRSGIIDQDAELEVTSRMSDGGVIFADGIEQDYLRFDWGASVKVQIAERHLHLVTA